jgi:predicted nucleic-acid-binding protein
MIAIDANIILRYLLLDDVKQTPLATAIIEGDEALIIPISVIMEVCWMLRLKLHTKSEIIHLLSELAGQPNINLQAANAIAKSFELAEEGLDLADALHHCLLEVTNDAKSVTAFYTFDKVFAKRGQKLKLKPQLTYRS